MKFLTLSALLLCIPLSTAFAQDETSEVNETAVESDDAAEEAEAPAATDSVGGDADTLDEAKESASGLLNDTQGRAQEFADQLDRNRTVQDVSTGILNPISSQAARASAYPWVSVRLSR